CQHGFGILTF
nr:immunoglobulin light chain junction region [Macaca mulatta]MOW34459.1 immunoglobulin light chain junction region [Macaca mulatta]MOW34503.1 immunoglobulin light chain junction region [Macaca mulatta]MOW35167.1 immunoglobulin light chain junction region [Macaca mulatta]MOW35246.1 immunoglobulin light chain junction region [Macaca mulatta]